MNESFLLHCIPVWIQINMAFAFCNMRFSLLFFFFFVQPTIVDKSIVNSAHVHYSRVSQITLFSNFFIKNRSHSTIYTFKNYFATVFSISVKIGCIQTNPVKTILGEREKSDIVNIQT